MHGRNARPVRASRVGPMSGALLLGAAGLCLLVRALPRAWPGEALAFVAGLALPPLLASPFEWLQLHGPREAAKAQPVGIGEPARHARQGLRARAAG